MNFLGPDCIADFSPRCVALWCLVTKAAHKKGVVEVLANSCATFLIARTTKYKQELRPSGH